MFFCGDIIKLKHEWIAQRKMTENGATNKILTICTKNDKALWNIWVSYNVWMEFRASKHSSWNLQSLEFIVNEFCKQCFKMKFKWLQMSHKSKTSKANALRISTHFCSHFIWKCFTRPFISFANECLNNLTNSILNHYCFIFIFTLF